MQLVSWRRNVLLDHQMHGGWLESWDGTLCAQLLPCPVGWNGLPSPWGAGGCASQDEAVILCGTQQHWTPGAGLQVALAVIATCREHRKYCPGTHPQLTRGAAATLWTRESLRPCNLLFLPISDSELPKNHQDASITFNLEIFYLML